jgi:hypothetical protein
MRCGSCSRKAAASCRCLNKRNCSVPTTSSCRSTPKNLRLQNPRCFLVLIVLRLQVPNQQLRSAALSRRGIREQGEHGLAVQPSHPTTTLLWRMKHRPCQVLASRILLGSQCNHPQHARGVQRRRCTHRANAGRWRPAYVHGHHRQGS